jgi:hypothetical protein
MSRSSSSLLVGNRAPASRMPSTVGSRGSRRDGVKWSIEVKAAVLAEPRASRPESRRNTADQAVPAAWATHADDDKEEPKAEAERRSDQPGRGVAICQDCQ